MVVYSEINKDHVRSVNKMYSFWSLMQALGVVAAVF